MSAQTSTKLKATKPKAPGGKPKPWGRLALAIIPGYVVSVFAATAFTTLLPIPRSEATLFSLIFAGLFYAGAFIYAFAAQSTWKASQGYGVVFLVSATIVALNLFVFT